MLTILFLILFSTNIHCSQKAESQTNLSAISCNYNGGRFGDNLASISKLIWIHCKTGIPCVVKPFKYWDQLVLYDYAQELTNNLKKRFDRIQKLPNNGRFDVSPTNNTLYITYFQQKVPLKWDDELFISLFKKLIAPRNNIKLVEIPEDSVSVAVHVRRGGAYKADNKAKVIATQFPPDRFFIQQIKRMVEMISEEKIYIHIFTDDSNPGQIVNRYKNAILDERIVWGYRKTGNRHDANVLEDFFSITKFQNLICSQSQFSMFAERLGNHQIIIHPKHESGRNKRQIRAVVIRKRTDNGWDSETIPYDG